MTMTTVCIEANPITDAGEPWPIPRFALIWEFGRVSTRSSDAIPPSRGCLSPTGFGDRQELIRLQAGATDERAVDVGDGHQFLGVARLHRTAVEDAHAFAGRSEAPRETLADKAVDLGDVGRGRH